MTIQGEEGAVRRGGIREDQSLNKEKRRSILLCVASRKEKAKEQTSRKPRHTLTRCVRERISWPSSST